MLTGFVFCGFARGWSSSPKKEKNIYRFHGFRLVLKIHFVKHCSVFLLHYLPGYFQYPRSENDREDIR